MGDYVDAKAEAEKRYPKVVVFGGEVEDSSAVGPFLAGAAWALREFGDLLDTEGARFTDIQAKVALLSYASEAHHIADGIEEGQ